MNKKILGVVASLLFLAILVTPAFADPTNGNKVAVTLVMVRIGAPTQLESPVTTGPVPHIHQQTNYKATIVFEDGTILEGDDPTIPNLVVERKVVVVPQKEGEKRIFTDYSYFEIF
jgi:hypothetical protein